MDFSSVLTGGLTSGIGSLFGGVMNLFGQKRQLKNQQKLAEQQFQYQQQLQKQQNDFNLDMWNLNNEYNSPSAQVARYRDAGLNVGMMMSGQNAVASQALDSANPNFTMPSYTGIDPSQAAAAVSSSLGNNILQASQARLIQSQADKAAIDAQNEQRVLDAQVDLNRAQESLNKASANLQDKESQKIVELINQLKISNKYDLDTLPDRVAKVKEELRKVSNDADRALLEKELANFNLDAAPRRLNAELQVASSQVQSFLANSSAAYASAKAALSQVAKNHADSLKTLSEKEFQDLNNKEKKILFNFNVKLKSRMGVAEYNNLLRSIQSSVGNIKLTQQENDWFVFKTITQGIGSLAGAASAFGGRGKRQFVSNFNSHSNPFMFRTEY